MKRAAAESKFIPHSGARAGGALVTAGLVLLLSSLAHGQDSQFIFDANGNLLVQTAATTAPPQIISQPQNRVVVPGESASFFVVAANTLALTYQWRFNGTNISGATNDALLRQNVSTNHEGQYSVVLTNSSGSVTSAVALLMIDRDADGLPDSWEQIYFGGLNQNATADFDGDGISNLTEFLDGTNPTNSASALFRLTVLTDGGVVEATPTQLNYTNGATVTLTATAFSPDIFHAWTGDTNTRSNPLTLTMNANKTVLAHFYPIDFLWTNLAGGDWNVASNWSPNLVPAAIDNAIITNNNLTVTLDSAGDCLGLTLGDSSPPPTLTGSGTLTLHGASTWTVGTMSGSGRTVVETNASLNVANPNGIFLSTRTLENGGTILWTGAGNMVMNSGAVITNRVGALFQVQNVGTFTTFAGVNRFDNAGTFRKSANSGTLTIPSGVNLNNSGTVEIQIGTLLCHGGFSNNGAVNLSAGTTNTLTAGGSGAGTFTAPATALVEWTGGFTLNAGAQLNGAGLYRTSVGTLTAAASLVVQNLDLPNGILNGTGNLTITHAMTWTAGTMGGTGRTIIGAGAMLSIPTGNTVNLSGRTLENGGTVLWTGAGTINLNTSVITNRAGGLFQVQNAVPLFGTFGTGCRFDNAGTFRKSANTGTTTILFMTFNNYGTVDLRSGILAANGGYVSSASALLNCALGGTTAGTGHGQLQVASTVTLNGALSVDLLPGFSPATNDTFAVLTAGTRSGAFANFLYPSNAVTMQLSNTANSVLVRVSGMAPPALVLLPPVLTSSNVMLCWITAPNKTYQLEYAPDLGQTNWNAVPGEVITSGAQACLLDALTSSNRFYRVREVP